MSERRMIAVAVGLSVVLIVSTGCKTGERAAGAPTSSTAAAPATEGTSQGPSVPGPVMGTRITEAYARMVARDAYFWAWPMVNIYNRRQSFTKAPAPEIMNDLPFAPLNRLSMLSDYVEPSERWVACPNQDVVYGASILAFDQSPAVVQVPDFGKRFWVYQVVDLRTDSFADIGAMYGTKPGFYLMVGPDWKGDVPNGITAVCRVRYPDSFAYEGKKMHRLPGPGIEIKVRRMTKLLLVVTASLGCRSFVSQVAGQTPTELCESPVPLFNDKKQKVRFRAAGAYLRLYLQQRKS